VNWSPSLTWSPSTAFTSGTIATNKDSGGFITGWTFNVSVPQQASSKVTLKFGLAARITYLKGNSIVTENRTFIDATLPQGVNVTADSTPPGIGAVTFRLNLRSKLCQLVGLTRLIEGGRIAEASIICENKNDESKLFRLNMFGDTGNAKVG
jgi:hypothetical protein